MPRSWHLYDFSGYKGLKLEDTPYEEPQAGEVRLRVQAFALDWGDMNLMEDNYSFSLPQFPARVGIEAAGVIDAIGPNVTELQVGDSVATLPYFYHGRGASTESLVIDARYVTHSPAGLTPVEASSIWMQYLTAYYPIAEITPLGRGDFALVTAATSTAGSAALEIGKSRGVTMIGTTRNGASADYLHQMGADHVIVQGQDDVAGALANITGGKGVGLVFDAVGGDLITQYGPSLGRNARIYFYGLLGGSSPVLPIVNMFQSNATFHPYSVFNYVEDPSTLRKGIEFVKRALADGSIRPRVDRVFEMEDFIAAWDYLSSPRSSHGKVVVRTGL